MDQSRHSFSNPLYQIPHAEDDDDCFFPEDKQRQTCTGSCNKVADVRSHRNKRTIRVHLTESARDHALDSNEFCSNVHVTSKYTPLTFIPVNLFTQFKRAANLYFLLVASIQLIPGLSPTSWATTVAPLSFVLFLNALKEVFEDYKRHLSDNEANKQTVELMQGDDFIEIEWRSIIVGDVIRVNMDSEIPADLVFLSSSDCQGIGYLETTNLDGETNLKHRNAFCRLSMLNPEDTELSVNDLHGLVIECEKPNNRLYQFQGSISLEGQAVMPLDVTHLLLRGATLRNTEWALGAVVFTGADTKYMQNMVPSPHKVSQLERRMNVMVSGLFIFQIILCLSLAVGEMVWKDKNTGHFYIPSDHKWPEIQGLAGIFTQFVRFIILLNQLIPISLYVTLELVKMMQSCFINWDIQMYYEPKNTAAHSRNADLNEELGQVEYVLSDKTGTLTQNVMAFIGCSIGGVMYGLEAHDQCNGDPEHNSCHTVCYDQSLKKLLSIPFADGEGDLQTQRCHEFFFHLAICHTVIPTYSECGQLKYQASSPDEAALVKGAALCGFQLVRRIPEEIEIEYQGSNVETKSVLAVLEFTSERKRMSIICRDCKGRVKLYCKGADTVILKRLASDQSSMADASVKHLEEFAHAGYRTLCIAEREIDQDEFDKWAFRFRAASVALDEREEKLAAIADSIERDLTLLGVTAIEDKLQDGVPETITILAQAGIKTWVLTGDKLETSIAISLSCNLLADSMHLFVLSEANYSAVPQMIRSMHNEATQRARVKASRGSKASDMAVVIEGAAVGMALEDRNKLVFLELCRQCRTVLCCRVTPLQKAKIAHLVKDHAWAVTLAIGDGANDVGMIKAAHIGVGISGCEGMAAVLASDYSIAQFSYLARLLLVHGRWSYKRNRDLVLYAFYKNIVYVMGNFYLSFYTAFSAIPLYSGALIMTYNLFWTSLPIMGFAILDKDIEQVTAENNPQLYMETQKQKLGPFFVSAAGWLAAGVWHSVVAFFFSTKTIAMAGNDGKPNGLDSIGFTAYCMAVVIVNLKVAIRMNCFMWISHLVLWIVSISLWFLASLMLSYFWQFTHLFPELSELGNRLYSTVRFWLVLMLGSITAFIPDFAVAVFQWYISPSDFQIMQEMEHGWRNGVSGKDDGYVGRLTKPGSQHMAKGTGSNVENESKIRNPSFGIGMPKVPSKQMLRSYTCDKLGLLPRRITWREMIAESETEDANLTDGLGRYGRMRSCGYQVLTRHTDFLLEPVPLVKGPVPPPHLPH